MRIGSLCSGAGGLDLAVEKVFAATTAWHCEVDPATSKVLAHRWPGVPNHGDLTTVDWSTVEPVDIVCAGWPCQPWSLAGKRKGAEDERAIWPEIARAVRELRPRWVCLENVSAVVVLGELARAAGDLAEAGYDAQWVCVSASEVGAPHKRERFFLLAADTESVRPGERQQSCVSGVSSTFGGSGSDVGVDLLPTPRTTDANGAGSHGDGGLDLRTTVIQNQWGKYQSAIERWETLTRPAPSPTELNSKGNPRLSARFAEWMMGLPDGWVTDVLGITRSQQLKALGNGVVPQQAAAALSCLLQVSEVAA